MATGAGRLTWFLRKGRFQLENRLAKNVEMLRLHFSPMETAAHPRSLFNRRTFWYDIHDTYIVRFVAYGCRKNLPLSAAGFP